MPWEFSADVQQKLGFDTLPSSPGDVDRLSHPQHDLRAPRVGAFRALQPDRHRRSGAPHRRARQHRFLRRARRAADDRPELLAGRRRGSRGVLIGDRPLAAALRWRCRRSSAASCRSTARPQTILGVLPPWFRFPGRRRPAGGARFLGRRRHLDADVLSPAQQRDPRRKELRAHRTAQRRCGPSGAEADLDAIAADIARESPAVERRMDRAVISRCASNWSAMCARR